MSFNYIAAISALECKNFIKSDSPNAVDLGFQTPSIEIDKFIEYLLKNKKTISDSQITTLNKIKDKYQKIIGEIRGTGLIKGLMMLVDNVEFIKKLMNHKMLTVKAEDNVIRLFPPLIVKKKELDEAINKIEKVCKELS